MNESLSENQLQHLLPALQHITELVQKHGAIKREDLRLLLLASGLDEEWAVDELERWAGVLAAVRSVPDASKRNVAVHALMLRGVSEVSARSAVEMVAQSAGALSPALALRGKFVVPYMEVLGMEKRFGRGHICGVIALDSERALVFSCSGAALFDLCKGETLWEIDCPAHCGALSPDGSLIALGGRECIHLFDLRAGQFLEKGFGAFSWSTVPTDWTKCVTFSPDGRLLASGSVDMVRLWDVSSGSEMRDFEGKVSSCLWEIRRVAFSPDGRLLAAVDPEDMILLWEVSSGRQIGQLDGRPGGVLSIAFSPDGRLIASGGDEAVQLWDLSKAEINVQMVMPLMGKENQLQSWNLRNLRPQLLKGHTDSVLSVAFSHDRQMLVSGSSDHTARLWEV